MQETPPRARGKPISASHLLPRHRNTPAGAGKTSSEPARRDRSRKHPRGRGENFHVNFMIVPFLETPPRARGKLFSAAERGDVEGNTPAGAGKTLDHFSVGENCKKHPRGRGENFADFADFDGEVETPPRARGKRPLLKPRQVVRRNTPAGAGKTVEQFTLGAWRNASANGTACAILARKRALFF